MSKSRNRSERRGPAWALVGCQQVVVSWSEVVTIWWGTQSLREVQGKWLSIRESRVPPVCHGPCNYLGRGCRVIQFGLTDIYRAHIHVFVPCLGDMEINNTLFLPSRGLHSNRERQVQKSSFQQWRASSAYGVETQRKGDFSPKWGTEGKELDQMIPGVLSNCETIEVLGFGSSPHGGTLKPSFGASSKDHRTFVLES